MLVTGITRTIEFLNEHFLFETEAKHQKKFNSKVLLAILKDKIKTLITSCEKPKNIKAYALYIQTVLKENILSKITNRHFIRQVRRPTTKEKYDCIRQHKQRKKIK